MIVAAITDMRGIGMRMLVSKFRDGAFVPSAMVEVAPHITAICERCGEEMEPSGFSQDNPETVSFKMMCPKCGRTFYVMLSFLPRLTENWKIC